MANGKVAGPLDLDAALFATGREPSPEQVRIARETAGIKANLEYLTTDLFPNSQLTIINALRQARTAEALWQAKGAQDLLDTWVSVTKARIKSLDPTIPQQQKGRR